MKMTKRSKPTRYVILNVEQLEERDNPGVIVPVNPDGPLRGLLSEVGPGLANGGEWRIVNNMAFSSNFPNNGPAVGTKQNFVSQSVTFGAAGYIDTVFQVNNSQVGGMGQDISKFRMEATVNNNSAFAWSGFFITIGWGSGDNFTQPASILNNRSGGLNMDWPNPVMTDVMGGPDPNVGFRVNGYPAANRLHNSAIIFAWGGNQAANGGSSTWFFNINLPDSGNAAVPAGQLRAGPAGYALTIRWAPMLGPAAFIRVGAAPNPSQYGAPVTLTATLTGSPGAADPTGTVDFYDQTTGTDLGTGTVQVVNGIDQATLTTSTLGAGNHDIVAAYSGDQNYGQAMDSTTETVTQATPAVSVTDAGGVYTGSAYAATATVAGIDNTPASSLESVTPTFTYYSVDAPGTPLGGAPSALGTYTVVASFAGSTNYASADSAPVTFRIDACRVTSLSRTTGPTGGGYTVTITGVGFTGATNVAFGITNATSYTVNSDTSITVTVPIHTRVAVDVTVTTASGTSPTSSGDVFTYINGAPSGADNTVTTWENGWYTFQAADFGFSDPSDSPYDSFYAVTITTLPLPGAGTLTFNGNAVTAGLSINYSDIGSLRFTPTANTHGSNYASFGFRVQDSGGTANGGIDLDPTERIMTINVNQM